MAFIPRDWRNEPGDLTTPITAEALEDLETRLAAYADTQGGGGGGPSIPDDVEVATDPNGANCDPYTSDDQTDKLQWFLDQITGRPIGGKPAAGYIPPGIYRKSDQLDITQVDQNRPLTLFGAGSLGFAGAPTVIRDTVDAGAGKWTMKKTGAGADDSFYEIAGLSFIAESDPQIKGSPMWEMRGLEANGRGLIYRCSATGYRCGLSLKGDHLTASDMILQGNRFGVELPTGQGSQGDIRLLRVQADGNSQAGLAIAQDSSLAGFTWIDGSIGLAPYGVLRYVESGAGTVPSWMLGVTFDRVANEYCGNGVVYDAVQDGAGISDVKWLGNTVDWGIYDPGNDWDYLGVTKPKVAAWFNGGPITRVEIGDGFPTSSAGLPAFKGTTITEVSADRSGGYVLQSIIAGGRPLEITGTSGGGVSYNRIGSSSGNGSVLIVPFFLENGTIARGELLTNNNELDAKKYAGTGRVIGVALHASNSADATKVCHAVVRGNTDDIQVKNTSGTSIAGNALLKPHASGGVAAASSMVDGQVIGRMLSTCANGALGVAEVFI